MFLDGQSSSNYRRSEERNETRRVSLKLNSAAPNGGQQIDVSESINIQPLTGFHSRILVQVAAAGMCFQSRSGNVHSDLS